MYFIEVNMFFWLSLLIILLVSVFHKYLLKIFNGNGPHGLPIIGYAPFLTRQPCKQLLALSKKYGPVYSFTVWGREYFILNSFESVKEALSNCSIQDRPHDFTYMGESLQRCSIGALNGTKWRSHRKFLMTTMMGQSALGQNCDIFLDVTEDLVDFIKSRHGRPTDYHDALSKTATNAITCVLYSKRYDWNDQEMSFITTNIRYLFHKLRGLEILYAGPIFKWYMKIMHRGRHHAILKASEACIALFERMAERRFQNFDFEKKRDFFDHFLANHVKEIDDGIPEKDHLFTIKSLASTTFSLIVGAADSSAETMYWALYFLAKDLVVQKKVQQELDDVIGLRVITMADRSRLPYMMAFMEETQRMACLSPMTSTREVVSNTAICGIKVPKGSYVIPNIYACLSDETYFKEPEVFDPTRFLDDNGKFVTIEANCQFTLGKRNCAGETFARVEMFTILATIVQNFNITFPSEGYDVEHTDSPLRALSPHEICINERYRAS